MCTLSAGCLASGLPSWRWFHIDCFVFITTIHMCPPLFLLKVTVKSQPTTVHCGFTEQRPTTLSSTGFSCSTRNPQCVDVEGERNASHWLRPGYLIALFKLLLFSCFVCQLTITIANRNVKEHWMKIYKRNAPAARERRGRIIAVSKWQRMSRKWTTLLVTAELCYWIHSISYPFQNDCDQRKLSRWRSI